MGVLQIALINLGVRTNDFLVLIFYLQFGKVDSKERQNSDKEPGQIHKNGVFGNKFIWDMPFSTFLCIVCVSGFSSKGNDLSFI